MKFFGLKFKFYILVKLVFFEVFKELDILGELFEGVIIISVFLNFSLGIFCLFF